MRRLIAAVVFIFILIVAFANLNNSKKNMVKIDSKNCFTKINACAKNGICGPQTIKIC